MKGLDLCRRYFHECVKPVIEEKYPRINDFYSCALIGSCSDVLENDDEYSCDHEWGPRLLIFIDEKHRHAISELKLILNKNIPFEFLGFCTRFVFDNETGHVRVPSHTHEGFVNIDFYTYDEYINDFLGTLSPSCDLDWLSVPENKLLEITSGEIFYDGNNVLHEKLKIFKAYYPPDVWKYRLAYLWQNIGWNIDIIGLCSKRGDIISEKIAVYKTILPMIKIISAYNRKYSPSYGKWIGKEFYKLPKLADETGFLIEESLKTDDADKIISSLEIIVRKITAFHNTYQELPEINIEKSTSIFSRGFWNIDCQKIADTIYNSVEGELKNMPLHGALDQFVTNEDFLISPKFLKKLNGIYNIR